MVAWNPQRSGGSTGSGTIIESVTETSVRTEVVTPSGLGAYAISGPAEHREKFWEKALKYVDRQGRLWCGVEKLGPVEAAA